MKILKKIDFVIVLILCFGLFYRIFVTSHGNFIFHFDSARDMLDVREMVVLHHWRLIGPTTGIDGLFTGPGWYYLLAIPFVLSKGNPYASVLLMHFFWFVGGYVLLFMMRKKGSAALIGCASLWIASNYLLLASVYAYSPNPVTFLSPLFIFGLTKFLENGKLKFGLVVGILSAFFWNLEMAYGMFVPFIILLALIFSKKISYIKTKAFWLGIVTPIILGYLPQIFFDLKHNFFMSRSVYIYLTQQKSYHATFSLGDRIQSSAKILIEGFRGTFMNQEILIYLGLGILVLLAIFIVKKRKLDYLNLVAILTVIVPFIGFCIFPLVIQRWHVDASLTTLILLIGLSLGYLQSTKQTKFLALILSIIILLFSIFNLKITENLNFNRPSSDPSIFKNEIAAIDYAYNQAGGKNFKAYVYSPGILDLPYQYNFWWYGQNTKYGYLPKDYAYLPNQPEYIPQKARYSNGKNPADSGLIILIKEPGYPEREDLWKNSFTQMPLIRYNWPGPLELEVRKEIP